MFRTVNLGAARRLQAGSLPRTLLTSTRGYASPSNPRAKPSAAQMVEAADYATPAFMTMPRAEADPHKFNPMPFTNFQRGSINLPPPLPADARETNRLNAELYRPTSALDTVSLLSICSSRPEFVPRAYQIFTSLYAEAEKGNAYMPKAQIFANVIHGVAQLCKPATTMSGAKVTELWKFRTRRLVHNWEKAQGRQPDEAALDKEGILVYRAWFSALIK